MPSRNTPRAISGAGLSGSGLGALPPALTREDMDVLSDYFRKPRERGLSGLLRRLGLVGRGDISTSPAPPQIRTSH